MIDVLGYIGNIMLATCALPLVVELYKSKSRAKVSLPFILYWLAGEVFTVTYILIKAPKLPLILNYSFNIISIMVVLVLYARYK